MMTKLPEWASGHRQLTKIELSARPRRRTFPTVVQIGYHRREFVGFLGNVCLQQRTIRGMGPTAKPLILMFTDVIGSSEIFEQLGDNSAYQLIELHDNIVRTVITEFGGAVVKQTGDGAFAIFTEGDAAVTAAIAIQRKVAEHNESSPQNSFHVGIGINAGDVIANDTDLYGTSVNLAARICSLAGAGEIIVTGIAHSRCSDGLEFTFQGRHRVRGFQDLIPMHKVVWS